MEQFDRDKFKAMIHYIADASPTSLLGKVKLNKILWFSDRDMYLQAGRTISGETYLKFPQGPVSKHILEVCDELVNEGKIVIRRARYFQFEQYEYISMKMPDIRSFSAMEIDIISRVIQWIIPLYASEASRISHGRAWETTEDNEEIPMYSVLAERTRAIEPSDSEWLFTETPA